MTSALRCKDEKEPDTQGTGEDSSKQKEQQKPVTERGTNTYKGQKEGQCRGGQW